MPDTACGSSVGYNSIFLSLPSLLVSSLAALPLALWLSHTSHLPCPRTRQSDFPCLVFALAAAPIWNSLPLLFVQLLVAETSSAPTWVPPLLPSPPAPSPQSTAPAGLLAVGQGQGTNWGHRAVSRGEGESLPDCRALLPKHPVTPWRAAASGSWQFSWTLLGQELDLHRVKSLRFGD